MFVVTLSKASVKKVGVGGTVLCAGGVQRHAGALHQHPRGGRRGGEQ